MEESKENFKKIKSANQMMLDYFNKSFLSQLEDIQNLKTQIFEIDIKIDELDKTKDIYAFKTNSRKSVFSPVTNDGVDTERNKIIQEQIKDLQSGEGDLDVKAARHGITVKQAAPIPGSIEQCRRCTYLF